MSKTAGNNRRGRPSVEEAERKRLALREAALEEFVRVGYRGASMRLIAAKAGISSRTLYNYYADKLALFADCLEFSSRQIQPMLADGGGDLESRLTAYMVAMHEQLSKERSRQLSLLIYREGAEFDALRQIARRQFERFQVAPVARLLTEDGFDPVIAERLAPQFIALAFAEWQRRLIFGGEALSHGEVVELADAVVPLFLRGAAIQKWSGPQSG